MAINFNDIRPRAQGQWLDILEAISPCLNEAIQRFPRHVACPVHGGKDGFRLYKDADYSGGGICNTCGSFSDGFALICWCNGWQLPDALKAVVTFLGLDETTSHEDKTAVKRSPVIVDSNKNAKMIERKREQLNAVKNALVSLSNEGAKPVHEYLSHRGLETIIDDLPGNVFFHPAIPYWEDRKDYGQHPAMVGLIRDVNGNPITYHRTYLSLQGHKADLPNVKKMMPPAIPGTTKGAAIHLYQAHDEIILAEGIETALALHLSLNKPSWACISARGLESVQIPKRVKKVIIGADNDANGVGQKAAFNLANRLLKEIKGRKVKVIIPERVGCDWLDVFNGEDQAA